MALSSGNPKIGHLKGNGPAFKEPSPFQAKADRGQTALASHAEADHLRRLSAEAQRIWACKCWALAGYRKREGGALSLQGVIQGRSEKEVVWRRVFYSRHSLTKKNKKIKQQKNLPTPHPLSRWPLFSTEQYRLECSF